MHYILRVRQAFVFLLIAAVSQVCAGYQTTPVAPPPPSDELAKLRAEFATATDLDDVKRVQIERGLVLAEQALARAPELDQKASLLSEVPGAAEQRKSLERQIEAFKLTESVKPTLPTDVAELSSQLSTTQDKIDELKKLVDKTDKEPERRLGSREKIRTRQLELEKETADLDALRDALLDSDISLAARVRRLRLSLEKRNLDRELANLKLELDQFDEEEKEGVLRLQLDLYRRQQAWQQELFQRLQAARTGQETKAAADVKSKAKKDLAESTSENPLLTNSYGVNTELAEENEQYVKRSGEVAKELTDLKKRLSDLQGQYSETVVMIDQVGSSGSVGNLLRQRKNELPNAQSSLNKARQLKTEVEKTQFNLFDLTRRQSDLSRELIESEIMLANSSVTPDRLVELEAEITKLIEARQELLVTARRNVRSLFDSLVDMEYRYRTYADVTSDYRDFLNERIFWIKSNDLLFSELSIDKSDRLLLQPLKWQEVKDDFTKLVVASPALFMLLLMVVTGFGLLRPRFRNEVRAMGQTAARGACDTFWPTIRTLFATCLLALVVPLPLLMVGFAIHQSPLNDGRSLFSALGVALLAAGLFALPIEFFRHVCRDGGLAHKHLSWSDDAVSILKENLGWLSPVGTLLVFLVCLLQRLDQSLRVDLIERLLFLVGLACLFVFLRRVLSPVHGIFHEYLNARPRSWLNQTSALWFGTILAIPILLGGLTIWGYYYTTTSLVTFAFSTLVFAIVVETLRALLMRFILVRRRHAHIESAKRKREAEREQRKQSLQARLAAVGDGAAPVLAEPIADKDPVVDIDENAVEANKLVGLGMWIVWVAGLWLIWADVLPALKALDKQPVFPDRLLGNQTAIVEPAIASATPTAENAETEAPPTLNPLNPAAAIGSPTSVENELRAVTYGDLLLFLIIVAITIAAARSLPSTLEMIFLNQLPFDRSVRYASKTLFSYAIVMIGLILAFQALGIGWSNIQWLATALTFGLAFGLQEIFANFISGIILMFERPMRIGDWITIDEFTGVVTKIRTRATTIVNWDRKEYVIPNKDFITGRLVNWTLSDAINRLEITVGVAYGSDVDRAKEIMMDICTKHPKIVSDPPTTVAFQQFGDSSLNLVLRAFVRDIESRLATIDDLHCRINREFADAKIEISFPQRDLHIRSVDRSVESALGLDSHNGEQLLAASNSQDQ